MQVLWHLLAKLVYELQIEKRHSIIELLVSLLQKFVSERAVMDHELRKRGTGACSAEATIV